MASNYPGSLDSFDTIASDKKTSDAVGGRTHRAMHNDLGDAIEAVQGELGTDPAGASATVKARFEVIEANDWVTSARIAADAVGSSEIAANAVGSSELADNAVDTNAIADSAVTSAKIADGTITSTDVAADTFAAHATVGNLLTANQAKPTTTGAYTVSNGTEGAAGVYTATGAMSIYTEITTGFAVGDTVSLVVSLSPSGGIQAAGRIRFLDSGGSDLTSPSYTYTSSSATQTVTGVVPANTAKVRVFPAWTDGAAGAVTVTKVSLHRGAGGLWAMPGTPIVGGSHIATNGAFHLSGTGTPEGVITAAPGSTWLQTDSTADVKGWIRWVKATGTGNTGWVAGPEADTGWRNVTADFTKIAYWDAVSRFRVRRVGSRVTMLILVASTAGGSGWTGHLYTLPTGWKSVDYSHHGSALVGSALRGSLHSIYDLSLISLDVSDGAAAGSLGAGTTLNGEISWHTNDGWPTSLPGSAA